jgi:peptide deformylase
MHLRSYMAPMATLALCACRRHASAFAPAAARPPFSTRLCSTVEEIDPGAVAGTDLRVLRYPHPALRAPNAAFPPEELTGPGCAASKLAREMFRVMYATRGVGLAAPQVGINRRLLVYNDTGDEKKFARETVLVNPTIVERSAAVDVEEEGCLSFPEMSGDVERAKWIKVEALNLRGKRVKKKFKGWEARIFQHEYDHLDGVLYVDHLTEEGTGEVEGRLAELVAEFGEGGAL